MAVDLSPKGLKRYEGSQQYWIFAKFFSCFATNFNILLLKFFWSIVTGPLGSNVLLVENFNWGILFYCAPKNGRVSHVTKTPYKLGCFAIKPGYKSLVQEPFCFNYEQAANMNLLKKYTRPYAKFWLHVSCGYLLYAEWCRKTIGSTIYLSIILIDYILLKF